MQRLKELVSSLRAWVIRRAAGGGRLPVSSMPAVDAFFTIERTLLRDVSPYGVRVYSLCGSCGAHLAASATLCEACARRRTTSGS
jgi:hypothetical protein